MTEIVDTLDILENLGMILPGSNVLDVGCGGGNWARDMIRREYDVEYMGLDTQKICLGLFEATARHPRYRMKLMDVKNLHYNPRGKLLASEATFPVADRWADLVICHSLFTHLGKLANAKRYISEIKRVMRPHGFLWITFFESPPNEIDPRTMRTVYLAKDIEELLQGFTKIYEAGGETTDYNDQLMIGAQLL